MHGKMVDDRPLGIAVFLHRLGYLPITFLFVLKNASRKDLLQCRPVPICASDLFLEEQQGENSKVKH